MMQTLEAFRTTVGAAAVVLAERALEEATSYAKKRRQFGKTLSEFQGLRFMLADPRQLRTDFVYDSLWVVPLRARPSRL